jgi:hypothetical protein
MNQSDLADSRIQTNVKSYRLWTWAEEKRYWYLLVGNIRVSTYYRQISVQAITNCRNTLIINKNQQSGIHYKKYVNLWRSNFIIDHWKAIIKRHLWWFLITLCIERHRLTCVMILQNRHRLTQSVTFLKHHKTALGPRSPTQSAVLVME